VHPGPETAIGTARIDWPQAWRIIASRYPPIDLFERVSDDPAVWDVLIELEQLTNPRVRDAVGAISLVPPERRVSGPNASWVMAPFTHVNPLGSRFSDGTYGVYYAADRLKTAIRETVHHFERFARDSGDPPRREAMRVLVGAIAHEFHDVDTLPAEQRRAVLDPGSYAASQPFARSLRERGSDGLVYPSVRDDDGRCVGAFWPDVVGIPRQERHLQYAWDGTRVGRYFDFSLERWVRLEPSCRAFRSGYRLP
jgi:RES domain